MKEFFNRVGTLSLLLFVVLAKIAIMVLFITHGNIGLGPDEAQYWTWSKDLNWGYYSKPPGIAWQIWLGTQFFGDTELGVRIMSVLLSAFYPILIYFLAWICQLTPRTCLWAAVVMAISPLGVIGSLFAITDVGMVLFWILACLTVAASLQENRVPRYGWVGLLVGLSALFKWSSYLFWPLLIALFPLYRELRSKKIFFGILISLIGLLPSLIWNLNHDWVTFRHVFSTVYRPPLATAASSTIFNGNFWEFLGAQAALLSPILFILLLISFWTYCKEFRSMVLPLSFSGSVCFFLLAAFLIASIFKKMQGNWCDFLYPTGIVFLCWYCCEYELKAYLWLKIGAALSIVLCVLIFAFASLQSYLPFCTPFKINPFKHNLGWPALGQELAHLGFNPEHEFLFADKYQMSSILSFYNHAQKRAYFLNLQGVRKNQFSFWPSMKEEQIGKTGYFVLSENDPHLHQLDQEHLEEYRQKLLNYFQHVEYLGTRPLVTIHEKTVKEAAFFKCIGYNGHAPEEPDLY